MFNSIDLTEVCPLIYNTSNITWGGYWPTSAYDAPHFEIPTTWKAPAGYKLEGTVIVPSNSKIKVQLIVNDKGQAVVGVNDGKLYRVQSGTYTTKVQAENARQALGKFNVAKPEYVRIEQDGNKWPQERILHKLLQITQLLK